MTHKQAVKIKAWGLLGYSPHHISTNLRLPIDEVRAFLLDNKMATIDDIRHKQNNLKGEIMKRLAAGDKAGEIVSILRLRSIELVWEAIRESEDD